MTKRLKADYNPKRALKPEEDQGYASVLPAVGAKEQLQKSRDMPKESQAGRHRKGRKQLSRTSQKSIRPAKIVYWKLPFMLTREEVLGQVSGLDVWRTLRASIDYGCRAPIERLHGYRALTERQHSQSLNQLSADVEPTDAKP